MEQNQQLYELVLTARESCAGAHIQPKPIVMRNIQKAIDYATAIQTVGEVITKLNKALTTMKEASNDTDCDQPRLQTDDLLVELAQAFIDHKI